MDPVSQEQTITQTLKPTSSGQVEAEKTIVKTKTSRTTLPPLFSFQISNPLNYLKVWWQKIMGNEGIKLTLQIKPLTATALALIVSGLGFGLGRITLPDPIIQYVPMLAPPSATPTPSPWRETAFSGKLQQSNQQFFLLTTSAEAITLEVPQNLNLKPLVGKRIMAVGNYHKTNRLLIVSDAADLEVLPATPVVIPTLKNPPTPSVEPTPEAML